MMKRLFSDHGRTEGDDFGIDQIVLRKACGATLSVHRFLGRWIIMRVIGSPDAGMLPRWRPGIDGVTMNVITDPEALDSDQTWLADTVLDHTRSFERCFPGLSWPATFVVNPLGRLVAILTDESYEPFVQMIARNGSPTAAHGAVDLGDINT